MRGSESDPGNRFPDDWNARLKKLVAEFSLDREML